MRHDRGNCIGDVDVGRKWSTSIPSVCSRLTIRGQSSVVGMEEQIDSQAGRGSTVHQLLTNRPSISEPVAHAAANASEIPVAIKAEIARIDVGEQPVEQTHAGAGAGGACHPRPHDRVTANALGRAETE